MKNSNNDSFLILMFKYILILIIILSDSCKNTIPQSQDLLEIGDYKITDADFIHALENNPYIGNDKSILFDNIISSGILINKAKKANYLSNSEVNKKLEYYRNELIVKYLIETKIAKKQVKEYEINRSYNLFKNKSLYIDFVWIPCDGEKFYREIFQMISNGEKFDDLQYKPLYETWHSAGVRFFHEKVVQPGMFIEIIERKLVSSNVGEILKFKNNYGHMIIKILARLPDFRSYSEKRGEIKHNIALAKEFEKGNLLVDDAFINSDIKMNVWILILPCFNFFINPIQPKDIKPGIIVRFKNREYTSDEVLNKILKFPQNIQALFKNRFTRSNALATMVLLENGCKPTNNIDRFKDNLILQEYIKKQLYKKGALCSDTISAIYNLINQQLGGKNTNRLYSIWKENAYKSNIPGNDLIKSTLEEVRHRTNTEFSELEEIISPKTDYKPWPEPQSFEMLDSLKIDFNALENLRIESKACADDQVVATGSNWKLTVKEFNETIRGLTPKSRLNLAKYNDVNGIIHFIAKKKNTIQDKYHTKVNFTVLNKIDIIGSSIDSLNSYIWEGTELASLHGVKITLNQLRNIVALLPDDIKKKYLNPSARKEPFVRLLVQKYWLEQNYINSIMKKEEFKKEMERYTNFLLADALYNNDIYINPLGVPDEKLNYCLRNAINRVNDNRLHDFLVQSAEKTKIKVNKKLVDLLGININTSIFFDFVTYMDKYN